jgi:2-phospho-L-lactate guanylyltransferase
MPVKRLSAAKTRLGLDPADRADLALAMALDTAAAALGCPDVARLVVICDDPRAGAELAALGAIIEPDLPDAGLNPALAHGIEVARGLAPGDGVLVLSSDVPTVTATELAGILDEASRVDRSIVSDLDGTGTTVLLARGGVPVTPQYGPGSAAAHAAAGHVRVPGRGSSRDVDTVADLRAALGAADPDAAPRTRQVAVRLGLLTG